MMQSMIGHLAPKTLLLLVVKPRVIPSVRKQISETRGVLVQRICTSAEDVYKVILTQWYLPRVELQGAVIDFHV